ncbi:Hypothetical predicted protein [Marmota monax]|uniref:Uncharacterized protein n=1 Tax=Marmota monax TaxID=9995 RepID=A0A5E4DIX6_MARMO|nr:Hypothetical predicted protein [Marmota monax]
MVPRRSSSFQFPSPHPPQPSLQPIPGQLGGRGPFLSPGTFPLRLCLSHSSPQHPPSCPTCCSPGWPQDSHPGPPFLPHVLQSWLAAGLSPGAPGKACSQTLMAPRSSFPVLEGSSGLMVNWGVLLHLTPGCPSHIEPDEHLVVILRLGAFDEAVASQVGCQELSS